jgi:hypothetical protein
MYVTYTSKNTKETAYYTEIIIPFLDLMLISTEIKIANGEKYKTNSLTPN